MSTNKYVGAKEGKVLMKRRKNAKPTGRSGAPSLYTPQVVNKLLDYIVRGYSSLEIAQKDGMPNLSTIYKWANKYPEFERQYTLAKQLQMETFGEMLITIPIIHKDNPTVSKNLSDNLKWLMARIAPKKYGDKVNVKTDQEVKITVVYRDNGDC